MINKMDDNKLRIWLAVLIGFVTVFVASFSFAQAETSALSGDGLLTLQGIVRQVSAEKNLFSVKVSKGKKLKILFSSQTRTIGLPSPATLKKGERVKVWYQRTGEENRAVKVELLPELGC